MIWMTAIVAIVALAGQHGAATEPPVASAAVWVDEFRVIAAAHRDLQAYDLDIEAVVETGSSNIPIHASIKCDQRQRCVRRFLSSTTFETPELTLMVNAVDRTITVTKRDRAEHRRADAIDPSGNLETLLQRGGTVSGGEITAAGRHWIITKGKAGLLAAEMYVNADTHLLQRLTYETGAADGTRARVAIAYSWRDPSRLDPSEFEIDQFVQKESGVLKPAAAYAQYRIVTSSLK